MSSLTLSPGTYCGGLAVSSINNVYFTPGIYYVANGDLYITSVNNVTCPTCTTNNGVTIVLTQTTGNNADIGGVRISSDNNISLNASAANQTSPPLYAGVLFYQDRRVPNGTMASTSKIFTISSLNTVTLTGAIYFPNNRIDISSINNFEHRAPTAAPCGSAATSSSRRTTTTTSPAARRSVSRRRASSRPRRRPRRRPRPPTGARSSSRSAMRISHRRPGRPPLAADRAGNVMLEFALALPILMLLTVGLLDLGSYSLQKSAMLQGARAGAQYGILDYSDAAKVNTTAQSATGLTGRHGHHDVVLRMRVRARRSTCTTTCSGGATHQALCDGQHCQVVQFGADGRHAELRQFRQLDAADVAVGVGDHDGRGALT